MRRFRKINMHFFRTLWYKDRKVTISTLLTISRIFLTPCMIYALACGYVGTSFVIFSIAAVTDVLDGALARLLKQRTFLGACLDPIADKILIVASFAGLSLIQSPLLKVPFWLFVFTFCKEALLIIGSCLIFYIKGNLEVRPTFLGKIATFLQIFFIGTIFFSYFTGWSSGCIFYLLLMIVLFLESTAFIHYASIGMRQLFQGSAYE